MLVNMNILTSKLIFLNISDQKIIIESCSNIEVFITITMWSTNQTNQIIMTQQYTVILLRKHSVLQINKSNLLQDWDFLFESDCYHVNAVVYVYIINYNLSEIHVHNDLNKLLIISWKACIKKIVEYKIDECYLVSLKNVFLVINEDIEANKIRLNFKELLVLMINFSSSEIKLANDVTIYSNEETNLKQIEMIVIDYS